MSLTILLKFLKLQLTLQVYASVNSNRNGGDTMQYGYNEEIMIEDESGNWFEAYARAQVGATVFFAMSTDAEDTEWCCDVAYVRRYHQSAFDVQEMIEAELNRRARDDFYNY